MGHRCAGGERATSRRDGRAADHPSHLGGPMSSDTHRRDTAPAPPHDGTLSRRNMLLAGTTLAASSALGAAAPVRTAQAQQQQPAAPAGRRPNILVIFGDDIGIPQISAYTMGMMGYRTP